MKMFCQKKEVEEDAEYTEHFKKTIKILLLGTGESGKTTIIKQMKILHINGFTAEEKQEKVPQIKQNIHESIHSILLNMTKLNPPVELKNEKTLRSAEFLLGLGEEAPSEYSDEYFDHVKTAWTDLDVQRAFKRSNEYQLIDCAEHFLSQIDQIRRPDYLPTVRDVLFCRKMTVNISKIEFSVNVPKRFGGGVANFWVFDVGGQRGERKKWIRVFEGIQAVLFLIAASDFDQTLREDGSKNRLQESFSVFGNVYRSEFLRDAGLVVFLNKQDVLKRKIDEGRKLGEYFPDFEGFRSESGSPDEYERARDYMKHKILEVRKIPLTDEMIGYVPGKRRTERLPPRDVYVHFTIATDTDNVKKVFESIQEIIIQQILGSAFSRPF